MGPDASRTGIAFRVGIPSPVKGLRNGIAGGDRAGGRLYLLLKMSTNTMINTTVPRPIYILKVLLLAVRCDLLIRDTGRMMK